MHVQQVARHGAALGIVGALLLAVSAVGQNPARNTSNSQSQQSASQQRSNQADDAPSLPEQTYMPVVIDEEFETIMNRDAQQKDEVMQQQQELFDRRYDMSDQPSDVMMAGGRKALQQGVRVKLPDGVTWEQLSEMSPEEIREQNLFPRGFRPLPHAKHSTGGQVFPQNQIDKIKELEQRDLKRFDVDFDLPDHLTPEFPPPIFLTTRPTWETYRRARC
jgi:cytochrome c peroxidase